MRLFWPSCWIARRCTTTEHDSADTGALAPLRSAPFGAKTNSNVNRNAHCRLALQHTNPKPPQHTPSRPMSNPLRPALSAPPRLRPKRTSNHRSQCPNLTPSDPSCCLPLLPQHSLSPSLPKSSPPNGAPSHYKLQPLAISSSRPTATRFHRYHPPRIPLTHPSAHHWHSVHST